MFFMNRKYCLKTKVKGVLCLLYSSIYPISSVLYVKKVLPFQKRKLII